MPNSNTIAGLSDNMPYTYVAKNEWWGDNETRSDELWNGVNTDGVCISLTDTYAREEGLAVSGRFPWDNDRGLYFIKGIHDMHCLVIPYFNLGKSIVNRIFPHLETHAQLDQVSSTR